MINYDESNSYKSNKVTNLIDTSEKIKNSDVQNYKNSLNILLPLFYENKYYCHKYKYLNFEPLISNDEVNIG